MTDYLIGSTDAAALLFACFVVVGILWWLCECIQASWDAEEGEQ